MSSVTGDSVSPAFCGGALRTASNLYVRDSTAYGFVYHDFTPELRAGFETSWVQTKWADGDHASNKRIQASLFYRF